MDTYRNWITDSVFSPKCSLCTEDLVNGETIRLLCFRNENIMLLMFPILQSTLNFKFQSVMVCPCLDI